MCCSLNGPAGQLTEPEPTCEMHRPLWNGAWGMGRHTSVPLQPVSAVASPHARPAPAHDAGVRTVVTVDGAQVPPEIVSAGVETETLHGEWPVLQFDPAPQVVMPPGTPSGP